MKRLTFTLGLLAAVAQVAAAQSAPNIMKPKQAAMKAAAASNAQTAANSVLAEDTTVAKSTARPDERPEARERHTATDSASGSTAVTAGTSPAPANASSAKGNGFERETFNYDRSGRRDPFVSLMNTSELRPYVSDLRLVAVAYDDKGRNSVAVLRDLNTKEQYRVRVGQTLGRMHVANIAPKAVVFTIEEFGYSRQETLALGDFNKGVKK